MSDWRIGGMTFDELVALACEDPDRLEAIRAREIELVLDRAPAHHRERLEKLQWRIDIERGRADDPTSACTALSEMMWDRVLGEAGLLESMRAITDASEATHRLGGLR